MKIQAKRPQVFDQISPLEYLKAVYKFRKRVEGSFSYEAWARQMGLRSRSYLRALVLGAKPLHEGLLPNLLKGLELDLEETRYFILLIRVHCASNQELKNLFARELLQLHTTKLRETPLEAIDEFLADPLIPTLFTYLSFDGPSPAIEFIATDLGCEAPRVEQALRCLIWNKLVDGTVLATGEISYRTVTPFFTIASRPSNAHLKNFHVEGIKQSQMAAELPSGTRKIYSTFFAFSNEQLSMVEGLIADFNQRLLSVLESDRRSGKKIYRLNQQLFPVSNTMTSREDFNASEELA